ncbi:TetR/AcrR family transcriptional regulator C-terminal domain-containing protein [Alkalibacterium sp. f15]|uniref:TetR/AcrR family transcriptional regulator n=1 Tax=Alkalibacterium sp. f15 TaxID=3414029 RepID=UPI003BF77E3E
MNKKQPDITMMTKQTIKDSFWELYKEKKIEKITVKDITLKAGYNRSTFYAYFTDVYDVLEQIEEELMPVKEDLPVIDTSREHSPDYFENIITIYEKNSAYYSVLLSENGDPRFAHKLKNVFKSMMMEDIENRVNISPVEMDYALEFLVGATLSTVKHWFDQDKNIPMQQLMPLMYKLMDNRFVQELDTDMEL